MALSQTAPLRHALTSTLAAAAVRRALLGRHRGARHRAGSPTLTLRTPRALAHVLRAPGELGLGRAYVAGMIDVDDLDGALRMVDEFEPPPLTVGQR